MQKVHDDLLEVLKATLWGTPAECCFLEPYWIEILEAAKRHGVLSIVLEGGFHIRHQVSEDTWIKYRNMAISLMAKNELLMAAQKKVIRLMEDEGIPCAVLKGSSLSVCYPNPNARALGDIDLLIKPHDAEKAIAILSANGFTAPEESYKHPYHVDFYGQGVVVELHYAVTVFSDSSGGQKARQLMESCWTDIQHKEMNGQVFPCLAELHQTLSLLLHMERHMTNGCIGLRQLCDWAVFVRSLPPEAFGKILSELENCGLACFARTLTKTCVRYLALAEDFLPCCGTVDDNIVRNMIQEVLRVGNINRQNNTDDISNFLVDSSGTGSSVKVFLRKLSIIAKRRYPVVETWPVLLPVFWVYIPMCYWGRSLMGLRKKKSFAQTVSVTKKRKVLYRSLRLYAIESDPQ